MCVIKGLSVSSALLGDDWLQFFLLVLRLSTYRCNDGQSIDEHQRLVIVTARMNVDKKATFMHRDLLEHIVLSNPK